MTHCILCCSLVLMTTAAGDGQDDAARKEIAKVLDDQVVAWNKGDLKAFMAGYWRSPDLTFYSGNTVLKGWDATLERYQKRYQGEGKEMGKLAFRDLDIQLLA